MGLGAMWLAFTRWKAGCRTSASCSICRLMWFRLPLTPVGYPAGNMPKFRYDQSRVHFDRW